ncbi:nitroreductase [Mycobacterium scrofulaceum]|uniref:nitroreductase family deazaflavin-dependent oxidoreductase n=1 Tax=Mycobacterium scrofulaceum TaxID=1783 RepID=UPI000801A693|nr:nitroreductase family deazaflavin-dependent oxidoreductase [Mycobacterium scrofulaceum]OBH77989.1 nitroreductase [Mycobacterium scrofulaceum]
MISLAPETWPTPLLNAVRTSNKYLLNPLMLRLAGHKNWYAAAIEHTGRRSGKVYTTPVVAERIDGGFVIPLPYGTDVDWLQNVRAAGRATISSQGERYEVVHPEIIGAAEALPLLSASRRRTFQRVGIEGYLKVNDRPAD